MARLQQKLRGYGCTASSSATLTSKTSYGYADMLIAIAHVDRMELIWFPMDVPHVCRNTSPIAVKAQASKLNWMMLGMCSARILTMLDLTL